MPFSSGKKSKKQAIFSDLVLGTLVYSVVLGFFNDYTSIIETKSYSTTFFVVVVLAVLTYLTLRLKKQVVGLFKNRPSPWSKIGLVGSVWLVLFGSKFVFLAVIDVIFGSYVTISGFLGLMVIIVVMTIAKEAIDRTYEWLRNE